MSIQEIKCPNCGASPDDNLFEHNEYNCDFCGSKFKTSQNTTGTKANISPKIYYTKREDGLFLVETRSSIDSISNLLNILEKAQINAIDVYSLAITNNNISNLEGIQKFESLESLTVTNNNNIETISSNIVEYFSNRAYKKVLFLLKIIGNNKLDFSFLADLEIGNEIPKSQWEYIHIPSIENLINKLKSENYEADRMWNRSENSLEIQKNFKSYTEFLRTHTDGTSYLIYDSINIFKNNSDIIRNMFVLHIDANLNDYGISGFFEKEKNVFYKYINFSNDRELLIDVIAKRTNYDLNKLIAEQSNIEERLRKKSMISGSFLGPIIGGVFGFLFSILIGVIGCVRTCGKDDEVNFLPYVVIGLILGFVVNYFSNRKNK
ncbi:hypothetical protein [Flavobacterium sp.]|uniref:hypothetical protein n=1 Tax=Flavobacterium sp. TaxID=239 RepID=UPI00374D0306